MIKKWIPITFVALSLAYCPVFAQEADLAKETKTAEKTVKGSVGEEVPNKKGPLLVCDEPTFNFGLRANTTNVDHTFVIRNDGDEVLVIDKVKASCGCTVANITNRNIAPGDSSEITVKLSLRGRKGTQNKQITVHSNDPKRKRMALRLTGRALSEIDTSPSFLNFGNVSEKESAERMITVKGNIEEPFKITEVKALSKLVEAELITVIEGKEYKVKVTLPVGTKKGLLNDRIRIKTDYAKLPHIDVRVSARITGKLVVSPDKFVLQENDERSLTRYIMVSKGSVEDFKVLEVIWPGEDVKVTPRIKKGKGVQIEIKGILGLKEFEGKNIIIKTDVPELEEILIPIKINPPRR